MRRVSLLVVSLCVGLLAPNSFAWETKDIKKIRAHGEAEKTAILTTWGRSGVHHPAWDRCKELAIEKAKADGKRQCAKMGGRLVKSLEWDYPPDPECEVNGSDMYCFSHLDLECYAPQKKKVVDSMPESSSVSVTAIKAVSQDGAVEAVKDGETKQATSAK